MPRLRLPDAMSIASTALLGCVFIASALLKAVDPKETVEALEHALSLVQADLPGAGLLFYSLISIELLLGSALLARIASVHALFISGILLVGFTGWIVYLMASDAKVGCGCGLALRAETEAESLKIALARNMTLLDVAALGITCTLKTRRLEHEEADDAGQQTQSDGSLPSHSLSGIGD